MAGKVKYSDKSRSRRKQKEIDGQYGRIMTKKILPVVFLVLWLLGLALVWWIALAPGRWKTDTIAYARMSVAEVKLSRGRPSNMDVLIAADGRNFALTDEAKTALSGKLQYGEECEIVYAANPIGIGPEQLKSLATAEDGEILSADASLRQVDQDRKTMWWVLGGSVALCLVIEVLIEVFCCKKERAKIAQLKAEQAKFAAREERQKAYAESKRAGG